MLSIPNNAFTLNNIGYVAELEGDRETAQFFYDRLGRLAEPSDRWGGHAPHPTKGRSFRGCGGQRFEGRGQGHPGAGTLRRQQDEPVVLRRRDNSIVNESEPRDSLRRRTTLNRSNKRLALRITLLEPPDVRLRIVEDVAHKIRQIARQGIHVGAIPAAARHRGGQSADKLKRSRSAGGCASIAAAMR